MINREPFLNHIATRLNRERREHVEKPVWSYQPQWEILRDQNKTALIDALEAQCKKIHTSFKRASHTDLAHVLQETIDLAGGGPVITAKDERLQTFGIDSLLDEQDTYYWGEKQHSENIAIAERANIGICFSDITLADSGTITLFNDRQNG